MTPSLGLDQRRPLAGERTVAAAVIVRRHHVLLVRRRVAEGNLSWQFPAGGVELGESWAEASVRETFEEVGLEVIPTELLGRRLHPLTGTDIVYFACRVIGGEARVAAPDEVAEVAWVRLEDLPRYVPRGIFEPVQAYLDSTLALPQTAATV